MKQPYLGSGSIEPPEAVRGFGRRPLPLSGEEVVNMLLYQIGALWAIARAEKVELRHVKPHGALYNKACEDPELAEQIAIAGHDHHRHTPESDGRRRPG